MTAAAGPFLAGCILLMVAGLAKVREPAATQRAMAALGGRRLAVPAPMVRAGGVAELVLGAVAFSTGSPTPAAAVAVCYLAFLVFVMASVAGGGGVGGCGCFGEAAGAVPVGALHGAVNGALAAAAFAVAAGGGLHPSSGEKLVVSVLAAALAWVGYLVLVPLPALMAGVREVRR